MDGPGEREEGLVSGSWRAPLLLVSRQIYRINRVARGEGAGSSSIPPTKKRDIKGQLLGAQELPGKRMVKKGAAGRKRRRMG